MGRCLSPCLHDLDPNVYRERLDAALALFVGPGDGGAALLARVDAQIAEASAARRYERAARLTRRRLVRAPPPATAGRFDAVWIAGGRVVDWGPAGPPAELAQRSSRALARA